MNRRDALIILLALGAVPRASFAQPQGKVWRVGFLALLGRPADLESHYLGAFAKGMRELGYVEGRNLVIEWRFADSKLGRLAALTGDLHGPNRFRRFRRPGRQGTGQESGAARRKHHRALDPE